MYIYERSEWPHFVWQKESLLESLASVSFLQGQVLGRMGNLGLDLQQESIWNVVTQNVVTSSAIEGEHLDYGHVRSSVARHLAIPYSSPHPMDYYVDGVVEMMFDALENYRNSLTFDRLNRWHGALFPTGFSGIRRIVVGQIRTDNDGPMQVVSRTSGPSEIVHSQAPPTSSLKAEFSEFLAWVNKPSKGHPFNQAAVAHLWFITLTI